MLIKSAIIAASIGFIGAGLVLIGAWDLMGIFALLLITLAFERV